MVKSRFYDKILSVLRCGQVRLKVLQVNLGYACNMSCTHCHVAAGSARTEMMDRRTIDLALNVFFENRLDTLEFTGGAPNMPLGRFRDRLNRSGVHDTAGITEAGHV